MSKAFADTIVIFSGVSVAIIWSWVCILIGFMDVIKHEKKGDVRPVLKNWAAIGFIASTMLLFSGSWYYFYGVIGYVYGLSIPHQVKYMGTT